MNKEAREHLAAHRKWVILEYAKAIGNNLEACREFGVPKNYMFLGAPSDKFPHHIGDLGGVRLII